MLATSPIQVTDALEFPPGQTSIVIVGANGSGKSEIGARLGASGAYRISARRLLEVPQVAQFHDLESARAAHDQVTRSYVSNRHQIAHDMHQVMLYLRAEQVAVAESMRRRALAGEPISRASVRCKLDDVLELWSVLFPGNTLHFDRAFEVEFAGARYKQAELSDGEKQVLYLAAKVLAAEEGSVIVVDEPELHLHFSLASRLWDALERLKPQARFIYLTHDLTFALSRNGATFVVARRDSAEIIETRSLSDSVAPELLGAASLPLTVHRLVFCEGKADSPDAALFGAWFDPRDTLVVPVGGCDSVVSVR